MVIMTVSTLGLAAQSPSVSALLSFGIELTRLGIKPGQSYHFDGAMQYKRHVRVEKTRAIGLFLLTLRIALPACNAKQNV
jgi:hypothetical protein